MKIEKFSVIGENIHCTRVYKKDGKFVDASPGREAVLYHDAEGASARLPIPPELLEQSDWPSGKVRHCAVAVRQGMRGTGEGKQCGEEYLRALALRQQRAGAAFLDVNVDEYSTDVEERQAAMRWLVDLLSSVVSIPLSIDSSNTDVLRCGLERCNRDTGRPMINSISLERVDAIPVAAEFGAVVIASAAGEKELPNDTSERLANLERLVGMLKEAGMDADRLYIDPLVFPIATDSNNARDFIEATRATREAYGPEVHLVGGFSNVSFGMPSRKLINQVFTWLAVQAGADGGIVDPFQLNLDVLNRLDTESESFALARDLLLGEDEFGMAFIQAHREGRLRNG